MSKNILKYQQNMKLLRPYMRYSIACFTFGWLSIFLVISEFLKFPNWLFFCFIILVFVSAIVLIFAIAIYAKCPACGKIPRMRDNHIELNATCCSHCDEKLK